MDVELIWTPARAANVARHAGAAGGLPGGRRSTAVNNGAAALVLATTTLAAGHEVVISRGELIEIGAGSRLPDLIVSTGRGCARWDHQPHAPARLCRGDRPGHRLHTQRRTPATSMRRLHLRRLGPRAVRTERRTWRSPRRRSRQRTVSHPTRCCRRTGRRHHAGRRRRRDHHRQRRQTVSAAPQAVSKSAARRRCCRWSPSRWRVRSGWTNWLAALEDAVRPRPPVTDYLHADLARLRERTEALAAAAVGGTVDRRRPGRWRRSTGCSAARVRCDCPKRRPGRCDSAHPQCCRGCTTVPPD